MGDRIAAVVAGLLVLGVVAAAFVTILAREEPDPVAEAAVVADGYVAAWQAWDPQAMAVRVLDPPSDFVEAHQAMVDALQPAATRVTRGPISIGQNQAETDVRVELDLPYADTYAYSTLLRLQREAGVWTVRWDPTTLHPDLRPRFGWRVDVSESVRAPIVAHDGTPLTGAAEEHTVGIEPQRVEDAAALVAAFRSVVPEAVEDLETLLARDDLVPDWFYPVVTLRPERFAAAWDVLRALPGVHERASEARLAPSQGFALHVLGAVRALDEAGAAELGPPYAAGDTVGVHGLEAAFEDRLRGGATVEIVITQPDGDVHAVVHRYEGEGITELRTTLDVGIQEAAENALVGVEGEAAVVVIDATSGAIRAVANRPLAGYNRAFLGSFPPGMAFRIVSGAALLRAGIPLDGTVACPGEAIVGGRRIVSSVGALGDVALRTAFAQGCEPAIARLVADLAPGELAAAAAALGFDETYDLPLETRRPTMPEPGDTAARAEAAIGLGGVESTVLHMASAAGAIVSGTWRAPTLLADTAASAVATLDAPVAAGLRELMHDAVADGSAAAAAIDGEPAVIGVTGVADAVVERGVVPHAWFVGARGDLAIAVIVETGDVGPTRAAAIAGRLLREVAALGARDSGA